MRGTGLTVPVDQLLAAAGLLVALPLLPERTVPLALQQLLPQPQGLSPGCTVPVGCVGTRERMPPPANPTARSPPPSPSLSPSCPPAVLQPPQAAPGPCRGLRTPSARTSHPSSFASGGTASWSEWRARMGGACCGGACSGAAAG